MTEKSALSRLLPLEVRGISMNDGSISFGPRDIKIVLGYVTNAVSFGDWLVAAAKSPDGRAGTDNPDTRVTQLRCARELVHAANNHEALVEALKTAVSHIEHMSAWIGQQQSGYSFESLGEDMPGIRDALYKARPSLGPPARYTDPTPYVRGEP